MVQRVLAAHVHWYARHKRLAWAVSTAAAVGVFLVWWVLLGLVAAVVVEAIVIGLGFLQSVTGRRRLARR
jgi:hypothetical protein